MELRRERDYLSSRLDEAAGELARLDLLNMALTQEKRQAIAAFNFIRILNEKVQKAPTLDGLYSRVVESCEETPSRAPGIFSTKRKSGSISWRRC